MGISFGVTAIPTPSHTTAKQAYVSSEFLGYRPSVELQTPSFCLHNLSLPPHKKSDVERVTDG
jgi:hypothetical protein